MWNHGEGDRIKQQEQCPKSETMCTRPTWNTCTLNPISPVLAIQKLCLWALIDNKRTI